MFDKDETFTLSAGKNAPDPRELLRKHNEMKEESHRNYIGRYILDNKMVVTSIKPEWLRREIIETISEGGEIRFCLYHGERKLSEYPIQLIDPNY